MAHRPRIGPTIGVLSTSFGGAYFGEVLAGIAETGSIVCASVEGRAVQASLLPSHHLAILPAAKIYATLDDFFQSLSATPPTNIAVITGPSRTADIELTLAIGVHGPERLDVIVVNQVQ